MLFLPETTTAPRDEQVPGLCMSMWVQYYLDNFATVDEAVKALKTAPYQLLMARRAERRARKRPPSTSP